MIRIENQGQSLLRALQEEMSRPANWSLREQSISPIRISQLKVGQLEVSQGITYRMGFPRDQRPSPFSLPPPVSAAQSTPDEAQRG